MAHPVFYKGEQVGEKRYYDERLAMFLLRCRDLYRYGARDDRQSFKQDSSDESFSLLNLALDRLTKVAAHEEMGVPRTVRRPLATGSCRVDAADVLNLSEHLTVRPSAAPPGEPTLSMSGSGGPCGAISATGKSRTEGGRSVPLVHVETAHACPELVVG